MHPEWRGFRWEWANCCGDATVLSGFPKSSKKPRKRNSKKTDASVCLSSQLNLLEGNMWCLDTDFHKTKCEKSKTKWQILQEKNLRTKTIMKFFTPGDCITISGFDCGRNNSVFKLLMINNINAMLLLILMFIRVVFSSSMVTHAKSERQPLF